MGLVEITGMTGPESRLRTVLVEWASAFAKLAGGRSVRQMATVVCWEDGNFSAKFITRPDKESAMHLAGALQSAAEQLAREFGGGPDDGGEIDNSDLYIS